MTVDEYSQPPTPWTLPPNEVHVWCLGISPPPSEFAGLESLLSGDERTRAARFHFEADRNRLIVGRGWLRRLVGGCLEVSPRELNFSYGPQGKPLLDGVDTDGLSFNLSHSHECILIALAWGNRLGIDVEYVRPMPEALRIGRRHFTPQECRLLEVEGELRDEAFFRLWARKESVIKGVGTGLTMPLDQFDVSSAAPATNGWVTASVASDRPSEWAVRDLPAPAGYHAALAVENRPANLCFWRG